MLLSVNSLDTLQYMYIRYKDCWKKKKKNPNKNSSVYMFNNKIKCVCVIVSRPIVSTISLYFTRPKVIARINCNVLCICMYIGSNTLYITIY